ncbi:cytochrome c [Mesonia sp. K7]|uniref:c-type cytochrome n=1 Tax=Mesonia sp. K7 TaxID=2218606 RepID=UPI000DA6DCBF|nr:cytochrome c [Mesonia sp. K7]PZD77005.1 cytochrome c [Mesonia sp. K7]
MRKLIFVLMMINFIACKDKKGKNTTEDYTSVNSNQLIVEQEQSGKAIYTEFCVQCHLPNGKGIPKIYPPLRDSDWLKNKRTESIHAVKYGLSGEITVNGKPYENIMTPLGLTDEEVVDVMNYIMNAWGNKEENPVTLEEVKRVKK